MSIDNLNNFSWTDAINVFSLLAAWVTIWFLLKDKTTKERPYLQITLELVRSSLACVVLRNVGKQALTIKKIEFEESFIKQLPKEEQKGLLNAEYNDIKIFPDKQWVISFGVIIPEILKEYEQKSINIKYSYSKIGSKKLYTETTNIDFQQYSRFLVYISEINELKEQVVKQTKTIKILEKYTNDINNKLNTYFNISDIRTNNIVEPFEIRKSEKKKKIQ